MLLVSSIERIRPAYSALLREVNLGEQPLQEFARPAIYQLQTLEYVRTAPASLCASSSSRLAVLVPTMPASIAPVALGCHHQKWAAYRNPAITFCSNASPTPRSNNWK
jgi:hypothetical protein